MNTIYIYIYIYWYCIIAKYMVVLERDTMIDVISIYCFFFFNGFTVWHCSSQYRDTVSWWHTWWSSSTLWQTRHALIRKNPCREFHNPSTLHKKCTPHWNRQKSRKRFDAAVKPDGFGCVTLHYITDSYDCGTQVVTLYPNPRCHFTLTSHWWPASKRSPCETHMDSDKFITVITLDKCVYLHRLKRLHC